MKGHLRRPFVFCLPGARSHVVSMNPGVEDFGHDSSCLRLMTRPAASDPYLELSGAALR